MSDNYRGLKRVQRAATKRQREQYWAEMQRLRALDESLRETQGAGQPEQQKEDQE